MKKLVNDLNTLVSELTKLENLEPIEKDILLEKIRNAYEIVLQLTENKHDIEAREDSGEIHHIQPEETLTKIDVAPAAVVVEEPTPKAESVSEKRAEEFSRSKKVSEPATLFDISHEDDKPLPLSSVHEKISDKTDDVSLADKLKKNPVTDLKKSIGINEKFSFINELFDGDLQSYNKTIDQLNTCSDLSAAHGLLKTTAQELSWEQDSETLKLLSDLVERRFKS